MVQLERQMTETDGEVLTAEVVGYLYAWQTKEFFQEADPSVTCPWLPQCPLFLMKYIFFPDFFFEQFSPNENRILRLRPVSRGCL